MKIKDILKNICKEKKKSGMIFLFDMGFVLASVIFLKFFSLPLKEFIGKLDLFLGTIFVVILLLAFFFGNLLIYSFFKYLVLFRIKSLKKRGKFDFSRFGKFYVSNIIILPVFFLSAILFMTALASPNPFGLVVGGLLFFPSYFLLNVRHSLFIYEKNYSFFRSVEEIIKFKKYAKVILFDLIVIIIYAAVFYIFGSIVNSLIKSYKIEAGFYDIYEIIFKVVTFALFYGILFFNRIYFYFIQANEKGGKR
jgi:hypothetical protein